MENTRASWASRSTFILAAIGSAVGLGNAWRFPGLAAKHGGGAFLFVYLLAMLLLGLPLLMMEISIGRRMRQGAPGAMKGIHKKAEFIGWAATSNAFIISTYYAVVFGWVLLMIVKAIDFAGMTGDPASASGLFLETIMSKGDLTGGNVIATPVLIALLVAWALIYYCIRNGANSVGKVVKFTVFAPVVCMVIMAAKSVTMPGAMDGLLRFFVPDFSALTDPTIWVDAVGQVFYSLSIMMAIMFAYGSFLDKKSNVAVDALIIGFSDMAISVLAGVVMFATMGGVGMLDNITASGISTAFIVYPQAIVKLTGSGVFNAIFGMVFYICLATLAIDSAFSIIEGVSTAIADKFGLNKRNTTIGVCVVSGLISVAYITGAGLAWLDIVDYWANSYNLLIVGVLECVAVGWFFPTRKVLDAVNENTSKFRMPAWWFISSIKVLCPIILSVLVIWNTVALFQGGGVYNNYTLASNIIAGWAPMVLAFVSGGFIALVSAVRRKKGQFVAPALSWDEAEKR